MKKIFFLIFYNVILVFSSDISDIEFGNDNHLDIITWNIEWFPKNGQITLDYVSEILQALDADIIAMQELDDTVLFNQMINSLDSYESYYESSWFAGLAFIYKSSTVEINDIYEIYTTSQFWSPFPRSPMVMDMNFMDENYIIINNHYKCCGDGILDMNNDNDEETRRYIANTLLKDYIDINFPDDNVIILGDLNDSLTDDPSNNVFQMFIEDDINFLFADMSIAMGNVSEWSYPNWPSHIDHILISNELFPLLNNEESYCRTIKIDDFLDGEFNEYDQNVSDHRPVAIKLAMENNIFGDINNDELLNIIDVILIVNLVLTENYDQIADINSDNEINILDVVAIVNLILN